MSPRSRLAALSTLTALVAIAFSLVPARASTSTRVTPAVGRWDLRVLDPAGAYPSWVEIIERDGRLEGRFVGRVGGARNLSIVRVEGSRIRFELPPQFEHRQQSLRFDGDVRSSWMKGVTHNDSGEEVAWTAQRAPALERSDTPRWGRPIPLLETADLSSWRPRQEGGEMCWDVRDGSLLNMGPCPDLVTKRQFNDFKLHLEFRMGPRGDSGVHLRGRYEIQLRDRSIFYPEEVAGTAGSVYGFIGASLNAAGDVDQWQDLDVTLIGRRVTVALNGKTVIEDREIPGITGDALDSDEGKPGPIVLQGYLGPVTFRNIVITPAL
jgi:hypothetical protein